MKKQKIMYEAFKQERQLNKQPAALATGVLVFDEVKVVSKLMWNSRNQQLIGLAMNPEEMASLLDVYRSYSDADQGKQTTYIMQFLWRDLTSPYDIVGPYYTSSESFKGKVVLPCVLETLKLFHLYGFRVIALVCDGASPNLSTLKVTSGVCGAYGSSNKAEQYAVRPWFKNPFEPDQNIYWVMSNTSGMYQGRSQDFRKEGARLRAKRAKILDRKPHPLIKSHVPFCAL